MLGKFPFTSYFSECFYHEIVLDISKYILLIGMITDFFPSFYSSSVLHGMISSSSPFFFLMWSSLALLG